MPSIKIEGYQHTCERCKNSWQSFKAKPKVCAKCLSPYWDRKKLCEQYPQISALAIGESVCIPWPENFKSDGKNSHPVHYMLRNMTGYDVQYQALKGAIITRYK